MNGASIFRLVVSVVLTALAIAACWWLWTEVPKYARFAMLQDFRFLMSVLVIFLLLSLVNPVVDRLWALLTGDKSADH